MPIAYLLLAAAPLAWLVPNHYLPWLSAWSDGLAMMALAIAMLLAVRPGRIRPVWLAFCALAVLNAWAQAWAGRIHFSGDAWMVTLYLGVLASAIAFGASMPLASNPSDTRAIDTFAGAVVASAIASVGIALTQWTGAVDLGVWSMELPYSGRIVANVGQPNHMGTLCFLGVCALGLLHQNGRVSWIGWAVGSAWLTFGMVMPTSRTTWLQMGMLVSMLLLLKLKSRLALPRWSAGALGLLFTAWVVLWPRFNEWLLLTDSRPLAQTIHAGLRPMHWAAMVEAIGQRPWWGFGWGQAGAAQWLTAEVRPYVGEQIEHSHSLALDLMVWNGVPVGSVLLACIVGWMALSLLRCRNAQAMWLLAGIGGVLIHAMLEFPLEYAYFLIPVGLGVGAVDALLAPARGLAVRPNALRVVGGLAFVLLAWLGTYVLQAEKAVRTLRLETARIGVPGVETPAPNLGIMTQVEAFIEYAQFEARPGLSPERMAWMRKVVERHPYAPVLFRYAIAQGLNGDPAGAALTLKRLCNVQPRDRCVEARAVWPSAQGKFPVLNAIAAPALPDTSISDSYIPLPPRH